MTLLWSRNESFSSRLRSLLESWVWEPHLSRSTVCQREAMKNVSNTSHSCCLINIDRVVIARRTYLCIKVDSVRKGFVREESHSGVVLVQVHVWCPGLLWSHLHLWDDVVLGMLWCLLQEIKNAFLLSSTRDCSEGRLPFLTGIVSLVLLCLDFLSRNTVMSLFELRDLLHKSQFCRCHFVFFEDGISWWLSSSLWQWRWRSPSANASEDHWGCKSHVVSKSLFDAAWLFSIRLLEIGWNHKIPDMEIRVDVDVESLMFSTRDTLRAERVVAAKMTVTLIALLNSVMKLDILLPLVMRWGFWSLCCSDTVDDVRVTETRSCFDESVVDVDLTTRSLSQTGATNET